MNAMTFARQLIAAVDQPRPERAVRRLLRDFGQAEPARVFIEAVQRCLREQAALDEGVDALLAQLATNCFDGSEEERAAALALLNTWPAWRAELQRLETLIATPQTPPRIFVERNNARFAEFTLTAGHGVITVPDVTAGWYAILLPTGRELWSAELCREELIVGVDDDERRLLLSATTDADPRRAGRQWRTPGGATVTVLPGFECGALELDLHNRPRPQVWRDRR